MSDKTIITRKIEIYVSESDKDLRKEYYKTLRNWSYISRNYANDTINALQSSFFLDNITKDSNEENKKALTEYLGIKKMGMGYKILANKYKEHLPSYFRSAINSFVYKNFSESIRDVLKGDSSVTSFKKDFPLLFMSNSIRNLSIDDKSGSFEFSAIPFRFVFGRDKSNNKSIVEKITTGEYKMSNSSFKFIDNKLFFFLVVSIPKEKFKLDENKTLGVDLGIANPAYVSINNDKHFKQAIGSTDAFLHTRLAIQKSRKSLQRNLTHTKGGRGRNHKLDKLNDIGSKERNFAKTMNHSWSKQIIEVAVKNKCASINIEDLKGIGREEKNSFVLRNWSYFELQTMIQYKADRVGIKVNMVNPKYSSQRCSSCGFIHEDNRISQSKFICLECKVEMNADYNASKNISIAHNEEYVKEIENHSKAIEKLKKLNKEEKNVEEMLQV